MRSSEINRLPYWHGTVILYGIAVSAIKLLIMKTYLPLMRSDIIGPMRYLTGDVILDETLPLTTAIKALAQFPLVRFAGFMGSIIGNYNYEFLQFFVLSLIYFIGIYLLASYFIRERNIALFFAVLMSITPLFSKVFLYTYPFYPVSGKLFGYLSQGFHPLILFALVSGRFALYFIFLTLLLLFHPAQGILFSAFACGYISFLKDYSVKGKALRILPLIAVPMIYVLYMPQLQSYNVNFTEWFKLATIMKTSGHAVSWMHKEELTSLLYTYIVVACLVVFMKKKERQYPGFFKDSVKNMDSAYYLTYALMAYVAVMVFVAIGAYVFQHPRLLTLYPSRLASLLVLALFIQIALLIRFIIEKHGVKGIPLIVLVVFSFYYAPFLFFPILWIIYKEHFSRWTLKDALLFSLVVFAFCFIDYSSETYIGLVLNYKKLAIGILYVVAWLMTWFTFAYNSRLRQRIVSLSYHVIVGMIVLFGIAFTSVFYETVIRSLPEITRSEKKLLSYIDQNTPKDSVFFVYQSETLKDHYYLYTWVNAAFRNTVLAYGVVSNSIYFPDMLPKIYKELDVVYGLTLKDIEESEEQHLLIYKKALSFKEDDWLRIKEYYKKFDYVLMSDDTLYEPPPYFIRVFEDKYFKLYRVDWEMMGKESFA